MHASVILVLSFCTGFGAGGTDPPVALAMGFCLLLSSCSDYLSVTVIIYRLLRLSLAYPLTHPIRCPIIDAYLGDIMEKAKKPLEPTKSALVREVEAKLGFKKFELNSLERANKATIVALLVR